MLACYSFQTNSGAAAAASFHLTEKLYRHVARSLKLISCFWWSQQHPELYRFSLLHSYLLPGPLPSLMPCDKERAAASEGGNPAVRRIHTERARQTTCEQTVSD